jgi:hypothetical protein
VRGPVSLPLGGAVLQMDGGRMTVGPRHRVRSWCMLAAIVVALAVLIALGIDTATGK